MDTYMITAAEVLEYSKSFLEKIAPEPADGWLQEIYRQMSARLFPDSFKVTEDKALSRAVDLFMERYQLALDDERRILRIIDKEHFRYEEINDYYTTVNIYKFSIYILLLA